MKIAKTMYSSGNLTTKATMQPHHELKSPAFSLRSAFSQKSISLGSDAIQVGDENQPSSKFFRTIFCEVQISIFLKRQYHMKRGPHEST
jgi:hypothetical protein